MWARGIGALAIVAFVLIGCDAATSAGPTRSAEAQSLSPSRSLVPSASGPATSSPEVSASAASGSVPHDPSLLELLPAEVDGIPVVGDADTSAAMGEDPALGDDATGLAAATVVAPAGDDFAIIAIVRFEPGVVDDAYFRDWRDSYDDGACSQAGGVAGHAQAAIGGLSTFIGTCQGGLRTYHVRPADDVLVSVSSLGERRLGEEVVEGIARQVESLGP